MLKEYNLICDRRDLITGVDQAWVEFALQNWSAEFNLGWVLGKCLWNFISDASTTHLLQVLSRKVRHQGVDLTYPFRCDSPSLRRYMIMQISPGQDGGVRWRSQLLGEEERPAMAAYRAALRAKDGSLLVMCGWCNRVREPEPLAGEQGRPPMGHWQELEEIMPLLDRRGGGYYPDITHTICPDCHREVKAQLEDMALDAPRAE